MSIKTMNEVWTHSRSSGRCRLVLLAIADQQGENGAWPSIATLAERANASERSIKRDLVELEQLGELIIERQGGEGHAQYKTNRYWVNLPGVTALVTGVTDRVTRGDKSGKSGVTTSGPQTLKRTLKETKPSASAKKGTRIPKNFTPDKQAWSDMAEHFPWVDLKLETHAFIDHWESATRAATKMNWDSAWKNWIRNCAKWNKVDAYKKMEQPKAKRKFEASND